MSNELIAAILAHLIRAQGGKVVLVRSEVEAIMDGEGGLLIEADEEHITVRAMQRSQAVETMLMEIMGEDGPTSDQEVAKRLGIKL